jgi:GNAT superfamily N-acetyltransferase
MTALTIRPAVLADAPQIGQLMTELGYPTTSDAMRARLSALLEDSSYLTLVAEGEAGVLGVAGVTLGRYFEKDGVYARLLVLSVSAAGRGEGTGSALVAAVESWAAGRGVRDIVVNSALHRSHAHDFYERRGYARTGFRFVKTLNDGA